MRQACCLISLCFSHLECSARPWHTVRALSVVMILTIITIPHKKQTRWEALDGSLMDRVQLDHWLSVRVTLPRMGPGSREEVMGIDGSPPSSPVPEILQARTLEWVAISFSNA